jgi:hypothetical protein
MENDNPYASPRYSGPPSGPNADEISVEVVDAAQHWRWQDYLVVSREATLPSQCVKCGMPAHEPLRRQRVYWYSRWLYLVILLNLWIFLVLVLCLRKKGVVFFALCDEHARHRRRWIAIAWVVSLLGIALVVAGFAVSNAMQDTWAVFFLLGMMTFLTGLIIGIRGGRTLHVAYIDKHAIWLNKLPVGFYAQLPQLRSADGRMPIIPWAN